VEFNGDERSARERFIKEAGVMNYVDSEMTCLFHAFKSMLLVRHSMVANSYRFRSAGQEGHIPTHCGTAGSITYTIYH